MFKFSMESDQGVRQTFCFLGSKSNRKMAKIGKNCLATFCFQVKNILKKYYKDRFFRV